MAAGGTFAGFYLFVFMPVWKNELSASPPFIYEYISGCSAQFSMMGVATCHPLLLFGVFPDN